MGKLEKNIILSRRQLGVSLLELLVVLVLISVLLGTVSLSYFTSSSDQVESAVTHLRKKIDALRDEAILQGRLHYIVFSNKGYTVLALNNNNTLEKIKKDSILRSEKLPDDLTFKGFDFGNNTDNEKPSLLIDSSGLLPPFKLTVVSHDESWLLTHSPEEGMRVAQKK